jgi:nucleolar protein 14
MAGGSQLVQLKAALSNAGVTRQPNPSKKRKRSQSSQQPNKDKKAAKLQEIHERLNPFDVKVTKLKHDVGGRKIKGVSGRPAKSKQTGLEQVSKPCFSGVCIRLTTLCSTAPDHTPEGARAEESNGRHP